MPSKKKPTSDSSDDAIDLKTLLQDDSETERDSYAGVDSMAVIRLIHCVSCLGGMVTFWYDGNNGRLCFSMRLFGGQRSYQIDNSAQFAQVSEPIVSKLTPIMQTKKQTPPPPLNQAQKPK